MGTLFRVYFVFTKIRTYGNYALFFGYQRPTIIIYKEVWEPIHGQILQCERENSNTSDPFAVSIMNDCEIMGHVPRRIFRNDGENDGLMCQLGTGRHTQKAQACTRCLPIAI